jgi:hypothetical protein
MKRKYSKNIAIWSKNYKFSTKLSNINVNIAYLEAPE